MSVTYLPICKFTTCSTSASSQALLAGSGAKVVLLSLHSSGGIEFEVESLVHRGTDETQQFLCKFPGEPSPAGVEQSELSNCKSSCRSQYFGTMICSC